jgi:hypothetical protein
MITCPECGSNTLFDTKFNKYHCTQQDCNWWSAKYDEGNCALCGRVLNPLNIFDREVFNGEAVPFMYGESNDKRICVLCSGEVWRDYKEKHLLR